ncbi:hypothetical protein [Thioclava indica]|uniref:Uncharacterized protein n=1 Tax=Thioclava indica TaxID=1353528 RepID=A0A074JAH5_9RHOB|nr:hypothetical protein [Thioclava indica]KEO53549.1 hypothetical protein DT23_18355 [Thioclava indica]
MERETNLVISDASRRIVEDGVPFKVDICKLEGGERSTPDVVTEDGHLSFGTISSTMIA